MRRLSIAPRDGWQRIVEADGLLWHEIAQLAKLCSILTAGVAMIRSGRSSDPKLAIFQQTLDTWIASTNAMLDAGGF